jgi:hypothetical protein
LDEEQFIEGARKHKTDLSEDALRTLFHLHDQDGTGRIDYHAFLELTKDSGLGLDAKLPPSNRDERGMIQIEESKEKYFGRRFESTMLVNPIKSLLSRRREASTWSKSSTKPALHRCNDSLP